MTRWLLILVLLTLAACADVEVSTSVATVVGPTPTETVTPHPANTATPAATADPTAAPSPTATPQSAPDATATDPPAAVASDPDPTATPEPASPEPTATPSPAAPRGELTIHYIDVGQGDATLIQAPNATILIDAGRHNASDVVPYLQSAGVTGIDLLIGTHAHADHIGQFPQVLETFRVGEVWMSGEVHTTQTFERALDAILTSEAGYHEPRTGETMTIGEVRIEVLNPPGLSGDHHLSSISVRIVYGSVAFVFTGDAEDASERHMIDGGHELRAHVLQLGHHGSSTSSSRPFLETVAPEVAVYSAGAGNSYGHPTAEVIDRLTSLGITIYGTDVHGTIRVVTDGSSYRVETEREGAVVGHEAEPGDVPGEDDPVDDPPPPASADCVDLNTASVDELQQIIHIGPDRAQQIIDLRPFATVEGLSRVSGIGPARLADIVEEGLACVQ